MEPVDRRQWEGGNPTPDRKVSNGGIRPERAVPDLSRRGEITEITPDHAAYPEEHAPQTKRSTLRREGYRSQLFVDRSPVRSSVLFDSLRCIAKGRGRCEGNREIMEWEWATGHKSTRITEKLGEDRMRVIQRTPMPDGSVMEEMGESTRRKPH
jgi:hypothetical protein